ncbi:protein stunted isoform X2 [Hermetia illucens]|uniref:protein stunted isoform X2 n=1 Tax=Hermetia illucens TaxID=343691 RepID=UPI0018CC2EFB|nr:protein stunted isoform X2 [Hermetia illucens]
MSAWRAAGLTYVNYSNIAARVVRQALKADLRAEAARRNESHVKFTPWTDGKPAHEK